MPMRLSFKNQRALRAGGTEESQKSELKVWLQYCAETISKCAAWTLPVSPVSNRCKNTTRRKLDDKGCVLGHQSRERLFHPKA